MDNKKVIVASLEEWDSVLNFYRPNGSSKTWYLEELKEVKPPLMWGNWNIFKENGDIFENFEGLVADNNLTDVINFVPIDKIYNSNHLYIINVFHPEFFRRNKDIGFKCISEKYKNDIRLGRSKIVILYLYEGYSGMKGNDDFEIVEQWRIKENFPSKSVYCITGNLIGDEIAKKKNLDIEVLGVQFFDRLNSNYITETTLDFNPIDNKCLFLSYNRAPRPHRINLAYELTKKNLINQGLFSLGKININLPNKDNDILNQIIENSPFIINNDLEYNLACNISIEDYKKTFISIVTETIIDEDTLFLSEKIWKPIIIGHPFMIYGNVGTLKYLKSIGYKTFDKWIDESYDLESNEQERLNMIVREIYKLQKLTINQLKDIRNEMIEICDYNKRHYSDLLKENWNGDLNTTLYKHIENIWYTFNDKNPKKERKYLPTLSELIDRLSICQLKEVFIPEHKNEYSQEIKDILNDINICLEDIDAEEITADTLRAIVVLSQMNLHIWHNESNYRKGIKEGNSLELTHGLNGIRNIAKNKIQEIVGGRKDYKIDCLAAEFKDWNISW